MDDRLFEEITRNITFALEEDHVQDDWTSHACFPTNAQATAKLILKEDGCLAGLSLLDMVANKVDPSIQVTLHVDEGAHAVSGTCIATITGPIRSILAMERTALNFVQHASGIATETARYAKAIKGLPCKILDTRKTLPGMRLLQKYAVKVGGGTNHRMHLADQILIKDNHLSHLQENHPTPLREAVKRARADHPNKRIQVEVASLEELDEVIPEKPDAILLDNMPVEMVKEAVKRCPNGIFLEASGGIHLETIRSYAETGVHGISIGRLTHSIRAVDMSLKI